MTMTGKNVEFDLVEEGLQSSFFSPLSLFLLFCDSSKQHTPRETFKEPEERHIEKA